MAKLVIEVPEELREVGEAMGETLEKLKSMMGATSVDGRAVDYAQIEEEVSHGTGAIERASHRALLQALDIDVATIVIGGVRYNRVGRGEAPYHTMAGSVSVERSLYRQGGQRGGQPEGKVVDAVSLQAGVVGDGWLSRTAQAMAHAVQNGPSREAESTAEQFDRVPYSRSSFERVAHLGGALCVAAHQDVEVALIEAYEVPQEAASVSVSLARVNVPMEEPRPRPVGRPRKGAPTKPIERVFRMAYCGTVTVNDGNGEALHTIRYGCMPAGDINGLRDRMVGDVTVLRKKAPGLTIQLLCDGAPQMWNLLEAGFTQERFGEEVHRLVDLPHLLEKLGSAARTLEEHGGEVSQR